MQSNNLKLLTAAGIQKCRESGRQCDAVEVAYVACLLEEQQAWSLRPAVTSTPAADSSPLPADAAGAEAAGTDAADPAPTQPSAAPAIQQQQQQLTICSNAKLPEAALAVMADRLHDELARPADPAAAATAHIQVVLERSFKQQQDKVEAEKAEQTGTTARLASAVAYKKVNMDAAGLPLYQTVFSQIVDYVSAAAGLQAKVASDPDARAQVSAAVESVLPLSSLAYFLTLPAQERMQQLDSVAAIACGICLFNAATGNAPSPLTLTADSQLLQASRLLDHIQAAAEQAAAATEHYNSPQQQQGASQPTVLPALAAAAAAYLGTSQSGAKPGSSSSNNSSAGVQLGAVLYCCQAMLALKGLAADLSAGIACCRQLQDELLSLLAQAAQLAAESAGAAVLKEQVFPLFESAGRLHLALKGELRLLLVRERLWEAACDVLTATAQQPGLPKVLGFSTRRRLGHTSSHTSSAAGAGSNVTANGSSAAGGQTVFDPATLPLDMEYVPPVAIPAAAAAATADAGTGSIQAYSGSSNALEGFNNLSLGPQPDAGDAGTDAAAGTAAMLLPPAESAQLEPLALAGMCPVSMAASVAAVGAAAAAAAGGGGAGGGDDAAGGGQEVGTPSQGSSGGSSGSSGSGLLLGQLARRDVGMIRYGGKLYGFSSPAALAAFVAGPKPILAAVRQAAHNAPLLFHMLGLGPRVAPGAPAAACGRPSSSAAHAAAASGPGFVASVTSSSSSGGSPVGASAARSGSVGGYRDSSAGPHGRSSSGSSSSSVRGTWRMPPLRGLLELFEAPLKVDAGTQTVTHVQERLIDVNYKWNDWALRRRIIALANLRHKATHSAQTLASGFRREGCSQTWLPKEAAVQTRVNRGSSVPKKLWYVTGLRGAPDSKMKVVSLELDVHGKGANVKQAGKL